MWQAILLVLKIIGIVLLVLLACLFIVFLSIMFVPVRYKIKASKTDVITGDVRISWFLKIINVRIYYKDQLNAVFRIFGIPVYDYSRREEIAKKKAEKAKKKETKAEKKAEKAKRQEEKARKKEEKCGQKNRTLNQKGIATSQEESFKAPNEDAAKAADGSKCEGEPSHSLNEDAAKAADGSKCEGEPSHSLNEDAAEAADGSKYEQETPVRKMKVHRKKKNLWEKLQDIFKKIRSTIRGIYDRIMDIVHRLQHYLQLLQRDEVKNSFNLCKKQLFKIWNHIKPKKLQLFLRIGFDDPAVTGQILAYYSMLFPIFGNTIKIQPEFEDTILEGNLYAKGRITAFVIVRMAWTIFFNKDIRKLLELLKKEEL